MSTKEALSRWGRKRPQTPGFAGSLRDVANPSEALKTAISPTRGEDYAAWYRQVVRAAEVAETSSVRGCAVIRPWGYAIWENMRRDLDARFAATGHRNAYFPLFLPRSLLEQEARHVEGLVGRCAVVTHHRLVAGPGGRLVPDPEAALGDPLIVRPTSETIVSAAFARWVRSYRDLPVRINQWANTVRWELRTHLLLRSVEFLWQEGHTAHATAEEAREETMRMLDVYAAFAEDVLAMPVVRGRKTPRERFAGAVETYSIEAMMQDRRAVQAGTSHFLGQGFSRASEIAFEAADGTRAIAWTTSWGVSTRLLGALVMVHGDDDGLALPPRLAPVHVAILPVLRGDDTRAEVLATCDALAHELRAQRFAGRSLEVEVDARDRRLGPRRWAWVKKGVPLRIEVGRREVVAGTVTVARRDRAPGDRVTMRREEFVASVAGILTEIQAALYRRAVSHRDEHTHLVDTRAELTAFFTPAPRSDGAHAIHGGFALAHWCGAAACEASIKAELRATIRCIPMAGFTGAPWEPRVLEEGRCVVCGGPSAQRVIFAKAY